MISNWWKNLSFQIKTLLLAVVLMGFTFVTGGAYHFLVGKISDMGVMQATEIMLQGYKNELKDIVDVMAVALASVTKDVQDEKKVYEAFQIQIREARFLPDRSGYYFIYKVGGTVFVHAAQPELEGKNLINFKDPEGKLLIQELDAVARGGGYVDYWWQKPGKGLRPKLSYARMIPGTGYWIGTGVYVDDIEEKKTAILTTMKKVTDEFLLRLLFGCVTAFFVIAMPLTWLLVHSIVQPIRELTRVADDFSRGKLDLPIPALQRRDEIGNLAKSFERLGTSTKLAMDRLKDKRNG